MLLWVSKVHVCAKTLPIMCWTGDSNEPGCPGDAWCVWKFLVWDLQWLPCKSMWAGKPPSFFEPYVSPRAKILWCNWVRWLGLTRKWIVEILYGWPTYHSDRLCTVEKGIIWQSNADASALGLHSLLSVQSHPEQLSYWWERFSTFHIRLPTQLRWKSCATAPTGTVGNQLPKPSSKTLLDRAAPGL